MFYLGKHIDTFEPAFWQLLSFCGMDRIEHIDCIGKRCFGFSMGVSVEDWFRPAVSVREAIAAIAEKTGLELLVADEAAEQGEKLEILKRGAVIGPLRAVISLPEVRRRYYQGDSHYVFVTGKGEEGYMVSDPEGFPAIPMDQKLVQSILDRDRPSVLYRSRDMVESCREIDLDRVLEEGLRFHDGFQKEMDDIQKAVFLYKRNSGNRLGLQYALMNYILQVNKVFRLADDCGRLDADRTMRRQELVNAVYHIGTGGELQELPGLIRELWELLSAK